MKTKLFFGISLCLLFSSCIKDFNGNGPEEVILTSDNYLSYDSLIDVFAPIEMNNIDDQINASQDENEIAELKSRKAYLQNELNINIDVSQVYGLPVPCVNLPNGKCVPTRLEFFTLPVRFTEVSLVVQNANGKFIGGANELSPMPGLEGKLNLLKIPVLESQSQLRITFITKDQQGIENTISGIISK